MTPEIPPEFDQYDRQATESVSATIKPLKPLVKGAEQPEEFRTITLDEATEFPPQKWLIKGVIPDSGIGMIYGPPSCGKTFLGFDLLGAVGSEDREWFGYRTTHRKVLYVGLEGQSGIANRAYAYRSVNGGAPGMRLMLRGNWSIININDRNALIEWALANGFINCVVMIDTVNRAAQGLDENKSEEMGLIIGAIADIQRRLSCVVIGIHHSGKDVTKGLRGHSSLHAALDFAIEVENLGEGTRVWRVAKSKDGVDGEERCFKLAVIDVGEDEDGDKITSCVVEPAEGRGTCHREMPKGNVQRLVWRIVGPMFKVGKVGVAGAPHGYPSILMSDAVDAVAPHLLSVEIVKNRRGIVRRAMLTMINNGLFGSNKDEWLWLTK